MYTGLTAKVAHAGLSNGLKADGNRKMTTGVHLVHDQAITISAGAPYVAKWSCNDPAKPAYLMRLTQVRQPGASLPAADDLGAGRL